MNLKASLPEKLEKRVDKWSDGGALGEEDQGSQEKQHHHNGREPPFFADFEEIPEFF
jgi:hypothetical protein